MDHLCYLCLVFVMLLSLFTADLWSNEGKGLTSWLLFVISIVILLLSHLVSWDRCGTCLYRFLILAVFLTLCMCYLYKYRNIVCQNVKLTVRAASTDLTSVLPVPLTITWFPTIVWCARTLNFLAPIS